MLKRTLNAFILIFTFSFLSACADMPKPQGKPLADISYTHLTPLSFAGAVHTKQSFRPGLDDVGQSLIIPLTTMLNRYAQNRFVLADHVQSNAIFDIERAAVTKTIKKGSVAGMFSGGNVYKADIVLSLTPTQMNEGSKAYTIALTRSVNIPHYISLAKKEKRQMVFLESVMAEIDAQVMEIARRHGVQ